MRAPDARQHCEGHPLASYCGHMLIYPQSSSASRRIHTEMGVVRSCDFNDAAQWRAKAEKMRELAEGMHDRHCRLMAVRLADEYDRLATHVEWNETDRQDYTSGWQPLSFR